METEFTRACYSFINEIKEKYHFSDSDILLWIYLNFYTFYNYRKNLQAEISYNGQYFMRVLKNDKNFHASYKRYEMIKDEEYYKLKKHLLERYILGEKKLPAPVVLEGIFEQTIQSSTRLKTGSYYTPQAIVKYMTTKSIVHYLDDNINDDKELKNYLLGRKSTLSTDYITKAIQLLKQIRIIDIACGGGAFLRQALQFLFSLNKSLLDLAKIKYNDEILIKDILNNNIYGIDIQGETSTLCKLLLMFEGQELCKSLSLDANLNIRHGDALHMNFKEKIELQQSFQIVLGNPPYLGERGNKELFQKMRQGDFGNKYYERNMDYFYFFIYKAYELLEPSGLLSYITTNYFVTADGAKKLRSFIKEKFGFREIINLNTLNIFSDARGQHNMIFLLEKGSNIQPMVLINFTDNFEGNKDLLGILYKNKGMNSIRLEELHINELYDSKGHIYIHNSKNMGRVLQKIEENKTHKLSDLFYVNQGLISGADKLNSAWAERLDILENIGDGIFVLNEEELKKLDLCQDYLDKYVKKFYKNSCIKKYYTLKNKGLYLLYIDDTNLDNIEKLPPLYQHLSKYRKLLEQRREVARGVRKWYALQWPRNASVFEGPKILAPQRCFENTFAYTEEAWYASADVYYISSQDKQASLYYLLAILNSSLMYYWFYHRGKRKGEYLELYASPLKSVPLCYTQDIQNRMVAEDLVKTIIQKKEDKKAIAEIQGKIDQFVFELYGLDKGEQKDIVDFIKGRKRN